MPRVRPLRQGEAQRTLAHRLAPRVDRLRQLNTRFGLRPYRVFLVWTKFGGAERGEGDENLIKREELLPTPKVTDLNAVSKTLYTVGVLPVGTIRVEEISATYTADFLEGKIIEPGKPIPQPYSFFYEVVEDDRGGTAQTERAKYRIAMKPFRMPGKVQWTITLERMSDDLDRDGTPRLDGE